MRALSENMDDRADIEAVGLEFSMTQHLAAQNKTWELVEELKSLIKPGMREGDTVALCDELFARNGISKKWHKNRIRFAENTLLAFNDATNPNTILKEDDIYFIDIGPVIFDHEGDAGETVVLGSDPIKIDCAHAAKELFLKSEKMCFLEKMSGQKLYDWAVKEALKVGWELSLKSRGHRISDFPHALHHKGVLSELSFQPTEGLWVLEIQIRHPQLPFGAFYEDILRKNRLSI